MFEATDCIAILGIRGCGKTTLSRKIQSAWPKQIIIDPVGEYSDGIICGNFEQFTTVIRKFKIEMPKQFRIIVRPDREMDDQDVFLNGVLRICYEFGNVQVVIEEIQFFTSVQKIPAQLRNCVYMGRHRGLSLLFVTQRPGALNKNIISQCRHVFAGMIHEKNDLNYLESIYHDRITELPKIPKGNFLHFSPGKPISVYSNGAKNRT